MAYEEQHQIVAEEEQRQKELMEKRKAELSQLLEEVEKTERKASIPTASHSGRTSQQSRHRASTESDSSKGQGGHGSNTIKVTGSSLIDDRPKTNGSTNGQAIERPPTTENGKNRRPSITSKAFNAMKRSFNIKSGKTTPRKWPCHVTPYMFAFT
jgi:hypothetical protein